MRSLGPQKRTVPMAKANRVAAIVKRAQDKRATTIDNGEIEVDFEGVESVEMSIAFFDEQGRQLEQV